MCHSNCGNRISNESADAWCEISMHNSAQLSNLFLYYFNFLFNFYLFILAGDTLRHERHLRIYSFFNS